MTMNRNEAATVAICSATAATFAEVVHAHAKWQRAIHTREAASLAEAEYRHLDTREAESLAEAEYRHLVDTFASLCSPATPLRKLRSLPRQVPRAPSLASCCARRRGVYRSSQHLSRRQERTAVRRERERP
jgi:hypothetical protein